MAGVAALAIPAIAQDRPESILPPGFGEAPPPAPAPKPAPNPAPATSQPGQSSTPSTSDIADVAGVVTSDTPGELAPKTDSAPVQADYPGSSRRDFSRPGVFDPITLGLGDNPWGSMSGKALIMLMGQIDAPLQSRWAHIALRNTLLASSPSPVQADPADFAAERAWLLLRMGEADAPRMLIASVDNDRFTPRMKQIAIQSALANGDPAAMCTIPGNLSRIEPKVYPLIGAMCSALGGQPEKAKSDIATVRRSGRLPVIDVALADKVIGAAAETGRATTIEWEPVGQLNIWRFGLSTATGMMPPERLMRDVTPQMQSWLSRSPMFGPKQRISLARTAAGLGVFSSQGLMDLYAGAYDATGPDQLGETDAWKLRIAFIGKDREARMDAMRQLWGRSGSREADDPMPSWVLLSRAARRIQPDVALQSDAVNLIASLFAGGFDQEAGRWSGLVDDMDDGNGLPAWAMLAVGAPTGTTPLIDDGRIGDFASADTSEEKVKTGLLIAALAGQGRIDGATATELSRDYALGLGRETAWTRLIDGAAKRGQSGTVNVLAASALRGGGQVKPLYIYHIMLALRRTNQEYLARMIAAEALARS